MERPSFRFEVNKGYKEMASLDIGDVDLEDEDVTSSCSSGRNTLSRKI